MDTQPKLYRNDPPDKSIATMAPPPPAKPPIPTAKRSGCGCFLPLIVILGGAIALYHTIMMILRNYL